MTAHCYARAERVRRVVVFAASRLRSRQHTVKGPPILIILVKSLAVLAVVDKASQIISDLNYYVLPISTW